MDEPVYEDIDVHLKLRGEPRHCVQTKNRRAVILMLLWILLLMSVIVAAAVYIGILQYRVNTLNSMYQLMKN